MAAFFGRFGTCSNVKCMCNPFSGGVTTVDWYPVFQQVDILGCSAGL